MSPNKIKAIVVTGVAAALCFGFGVPAGAHVAPSSEPVVEHTFQPPTLAQVQSYLDAIISAKISRLDAVAARVAADPLLTADQKSRFAAKVARIRQNLVDLKSAIDAATSTQQVHEVLEAAYPGLFFPARPHHLRFHRRDRAAALPATAIRRDSGVRVFDPRFGTGCRHAGDPDSWQRYRGGMSGTWQSAAYRYGGGFHHHR